ncbi:MAG: helix-turn-helix domain-containing protein [Taibaiella sp.]|nr:helix-turn-helix domain-containing protein [Taibaiella sp.]
MEPLKYKIIKTKKQYVQYCNTLEQLVEQGSKNKMALEEIELLTLLIEKWDNEHNTFNDTDPIVLLKYLMEERNLKPKDLADMLQVSKGLVSDILNYKKGLSKEIIRTLSTYFKVSQEAFNKPYKLISSINSHLKNASVMNTTKELMTELS